jgi:hypothetical protein
MMGNFLNSKLKHGKLTYDCKRFSARLFMDKILSARVDEAIIQQVGILAKELNTTKKAIIEAAIKHYSEQKGLEKKINIFDKTCGAWKRSETVQESVSKARSAFNKSMKRHHQ